jgi:hypothetical protein
MAKPHYENPDRNVPIFEEIFRRNGLDWVLIGGLAAIRRRSDKRETVDVDFVVSGLEDLEAQLLETGTRWLKIAREPNGTPYLIQGETNDGMHFDIYVHDWDPKDEFEFERAVLETKDDYHVASAEAIIVYKLMAMRPQDIDDIQSILRAHPNFDGLDLEFIEKWAREYDLYDLWAEFVNEARRNSPTKLAYPLPPRSRGPKQGKQREGLIRKTGVDKNGHPYTRWVRP